MYFAIVQMNYAANIQLILRKYKGNKMFFLRKMRTGLSQNSELLWHSTVPADDLEFLIILSRNMELSFLRLIFFETVSFKQKSPEGIKKPSRDWKIKHYAFLQTGAPILRMVFPETSFRIIPAIMYHALSAQKMSS